MTEDAPALWDLWVRQGGGEGIVLKEPGSLYYPGQRSPAWLKVKHKVTLEAVVTGGSGELVQWGDWGLATHLALIYSHPQTGEPVRHRAGGARAAGADFQLRPGARAEILTWGIMPSGLLRHPLFLRCL